MVMGEIGVDREQAEALLAKFGNVRGAIEGFAQAQSTK